MACSRQDDHPPRSRPTPMGRVRDRSGMAAGDVSRETSVINWCPPAGKGSGVHRRSHSRLSMPGRSVPPSIAWSLCGAARDKGGSPSCRRRLAACRCGWDRVPPGGETGGGHGQSLAASVLGIQWRETDLVRRSVSGPCLLDRSWVADRRLDYGSRMALRPWPPRAPRATRFERPVWRAPGDEIRRRRASDGKTHERTWPRIAKPSNSGHGRLRPIVDARLPVTHQAEIATAHGAREGRCAFCGSSTSTHSLVPRQPAGSVGGSGVRGLSALRRFDL
jgi:hypothetical protein